MLTFLDLPWEDIILSEILPYLHTKDCFSLRATSLSCKRLIEIFFERLNTFDFKRCSHINAAAFYVLVTGTSSLKRLSVVGCPLVTDEHLTTIFRSNKKLAHVDLSFTTNLSNVCLHSLTIFCKELLSLNLSNCTWVSQEALQFFGMSNNKIEILNISNIGLLGDDTVKTLIFFLHKLKNLDLGGNPLLTDCTVHHISLVCGKFEEVSFTNCKAISNYCLTTFQRSYPHIKIVR